jgi:uncharacterized membrane protein
VVFTSILPFFDQPSVIRAIAAAILVFFLPGFAWSLVFFKQLSNLERLALSFVLSIAIVTLSIICFNVVFKISITGFNTLLIIILVTIVPAVLYFTGKKLSRKKAAPPDAKNV